MEKIIKTIKLHKNEAKGLGYQLNVAMAELLDIDITVNSTGQYGEKYKSFTIFEKTIKTDVDRYEITVYYITK